MRFDAEYLTWWGFEARYAGASLLKLEFSAPVTGTGFVTWIVVDGRRLLYVGEKMTSGSATGTPSRRRRFVNMPERDPKKLGIFGAPQCRCTPLVLALCVGLTGLVTVGAGACMAAFMWHDSTPRALGFALVGLGVSMISAGVGLFIYDWCVRSLMPRDTVSVSYAYQPHGNVQTAPTTLTAPPVANGQPVSTVTNVHAMPSSANYGRRPQAIQDTAPPPYDAVLEEDTRHRPQHTHGARERYVSTISQGRMGQPSAPRQSRITDSVV